MENLQIDKNNFEKFLQSNWTKFINPHKFIVFVLHCVEKSNLTTVHNNSFTKKNNLNVSVSQFKPSNNGNFEIWADFYIPKKEGVAIGTCEFKFNIKSCLIEHITTIGCFQKHSDNI